MEVTISDLMPRVLNGAEWLDRVQPEWAGRINLDTLKLDECSRCALGQVFGDYDRAVNAYSPGMAFDCAEGDAWANSHGFAVFDVPYEHGNWESRWNVLRECWVTVILERRFKEQSSETERTSLSHAGDPADATDALQVVRATS